MKRKFKGFGMAAAVLASTIVVTVVPASTPALAVAYGTVSRDATASTPLGTSATGGEVRTIVAQSDGKILIGGSFTGWNGTATGGLVRLNADLSLDTTFVTNLGAGATGGTVQIRDIAIRADGKIVVAGELTAWDGVASYGVVVLNADGTVNHQVPGSSRTVYTVATDSSNRAYVGGNWAYWDMNIYKGEKWARIAAANSATDGPFSYLSGSHSNRLNSSATRIRVIEPYVYVAGAFTDAGKYPETAPSPTPVGRFARFDLNGVLDQTFNSGTGVGAQGGVDTFLPLPDGKFLLGGTFSSWNDSSATAVAGQYKLVRLNADGTIDTTFDTSAVATSMPDITSLAVDSSGRILVGCICGASVSWKWDNVDVGRGFVRLTPDGALDAYVPLNENSTLSTGARAGTTAKKVYAIHALPNGKILVGGDFTHWSGVSTGAVTVLSVTNPAPSVSSVSPTSGSTNGGTSLTITGAGFVSGATVTVGGSSCTSVTVVSATSITCTAPAGTAGAKNIVVTNADSQVGTGTGLFTYVAPPTVSSISPTSGPVVGGTAVTITGTGFSAGATVVIGGAACASVVVVSATSITCTAGVGSSGARDVVVTNSDSQSGTAVGVYTFVPAPTVTSVAPLVGPVLGGTAVTITGTGFLTGATATFGGSACTTVVVVSATSITCVTPSHASGAVSVVVTNSDSQSGTLSNGFTYQTTTTTTTTTTPATPQSSQSSSQTSAISAAGPTLVTLSNQAQLEAAPGSANAIINGKEVAVEVVKAPVEATPEQLKRTADSIVADIADLLPPGVANPVSVRATSTGVEINGIMVNPDDPKEKLGVPVESVQLVKAGDTAVLLAALNQTNLPAEKGSGGALEVTRGGIVSATAYGLPGSETGEIVLMSTPRLLQTFTVDKNGGFKGQVPLPKDIAFGSHTVVMATKNAKVSLGIKLVRTKMQFRIKRKIGTALFKNRAGVVKVGGGKVTVTGSGRCRANSKRVVMAAKPGGCYITVRQAAKGANKAIYYRFTVSVVKKLPKKVATKKK